MANLKSKLGERIKTLRKEQGYTQEAFSEKIGIASSSLGYLETGKFYPTPENVEKIAHGLGIEVHDLFYFKDINDKEALVSEIKNDIDVIKNDNGKLLALYHFIRQLL